MTDKQIINKIKAEFSDNKIKAFMQELNLSELEVCLYLDFFNNVSVRTDDQRKNSGRKMYISFAKRVAELLENSYDR